MDSDSATEAALTEHVADVLRGEANALGRQWLDLLQDRSGVQPADSLLDLVPPVVSAVADVVADPRHNPQSEPVKLSLSRLADLRRDRERSVGEVLEEFRLLSTLVSDVVEKAIDSYEGTATPGALARILTRAQSTMFALSAETADRYRTWDRRRTREKLRLLEGYTDMLAHELANRLGAAETAVRLIVGSGSALSEERISRLHRLILDSLEGGLETVQSVRGLVNAEGFGGPVGSRTLPLESIVRDAVHQMRVNAAERGIEIHVTSAGPAVPIDAERFPLAFLNLVANAIRHHDTPNGTGEIVVEVSQTDDTFLIDVLDDGPGIPPDLRDGLFEPRVRGAGASDGEGLGLAIARDAIEEMGGGLSYEPREERGSLFRMCVPRTWSNEDIDCEPSELGDASGRSWRGSREQTAGRPAN